MDEQGNFKVTDRRLFNADGSPREVAPEEKREAQSTAEPAIPPSPPSAVVESAGAAPESELGEEDFDEAEMADAQDPASFVNFAMSIASNAASALGMMEHPVTHQREVDLELGKHWIDVLGMLQEKTTGNLNTAEAKILQSWLADLRMQYVSLSSSASAAAPQGYSGRDIIGGK